MDTSAPVRSRHSWVRAWTARNDVQRVELYTRGSLFVLFWFLLVLGVLSSLPAFDRPGSILLMIGGGVLLGGLGTSLLRAACDLYPERGPLPVRRLAALAGLAALVAAWVATLPADERFGPAFVLVGAIAWGAGGLRDPRVLAVVVAAGAAILGLSDGHLGMALYGAAIAAFFAFTVHSSLWLLGVVTELDRARATQAALAVAEERLRFSRDVHDVLGRHLSTIAVQAELAATLAERGDERAPDLVREVRSTAHEALREARGLARGYRPLDLHQELDGAVSLLASAGIAATADLDGLPAAWHAPVARVVRETVTNVLRHSEATRVAIEYDGRRVTVRNDGVGRAPDPDGDGSGLATLAGDLAPLGARLDHEHVSARSGGGASGGEFVVTLDLGVDGGPGQEER
ncbi:sensor histidine kinase [Nocardioides houyundeii]|uniref:sensor histidine kinase n=1 Tax=Nocardioides houyundeii TaxID=2045452 RepID=UPI000DF4C5A8|nr:histidine kinase [Nocardioides houyundeii]